MNPVRSERDLPMSVRAKDRARVRASADRRRGVPSVDTLLRSSPGRKGAAKFGRPLVKRALQAVLAETRRKAARGGEVPSDDLLLARALGEAARIFYGIGEVINATGVLLHTGLGRAPLPKQAIEAAARAARGYADLEVDRESGGRGRRTGRAEALIEAITGAEDALVVNNNAAALMLSLAALAGRKEVVVSRGELIEIGGEFRLPDIMAASGAKLVEVGDLADIARAGTIPLLYDIGSGLLERYSEVPADEPAVSEALSGGADLVAFSGDKLLGGPQAGVIAGRSDLLERLRRHPMARAVRVDKMTVAALESVLRLYATGRRHDLPIWQMLSERQSHLLARARGLASVFTGAVARPSEAVAGGGALPGYALPSAELVVPAASPGRVAARLRLGQPPVFCRMEDGGLVFDLRTVPPESDDRLARAIRYVLEQA